MFKTVPFLKFRLLPPEHLDFIYVVLYVGRARCPDDYPFAFKWGEYCCATPFEEISSIHIDGCNGGDLSMSSICCDKNNYRQCPSDQGCIDNKVKGIRICIQ